MPLCISPGGCRGGWGAPWRGGGGAVGTSSGLAAGRDRFSLCMDVAGGSGGESGAETRLHSAIIEYGDEG